MSKLIEANDLKALIKRNSEANAELNAALIMAAAMWGVKASELSKIKVSDVVSNKGVIKPRWVLRSEIAFNLKRRELYTENDNLVAFLDRYLDYRTNDKIEVSSHGEYRGLNPESKLFLTPGKNEPFKFSRRNVDSDENMQPVGMNTYFKKLIKNSGITGITYKSFRNSLVKHMWREGGRKTGVIKDIMDYLGIRSYSAIRKILSSDKRDLHEMVKGIHKKI